MPDVAALYIRRDSIYKRMRGVSCWDDRRDARRYRGPWPVVAHPPCRLWGRLRGCSTADTAEMALAVDAIESLIMFGGVVEHPDSSTLVDWIECIPRVRRLHIRQSDFGHLAAKPTWLLIVGSSPADWPDLPLRLTPITHVICRSRHGGRPSVPRATWREQGASALAWMVEVARRSRVERPVMA